MREAEPPLPALVTGMEHSGPTVLSKLLTAHPRVNAAFECDIQLGDTPADIPGLSPWADWFTAALVEGTPDREKGRRNCVKIAQNPFLPEHELDDDLLHLRKSVAKFLPFHQM